MINQILQADFIFSDWALHPNFRNIERLLQKIGNEISTKDCVIFPLYTYGLSNQNAIIESARHEFRQIPKNTTIYSIMGLHTDHGVHHCAAIHEGNNQVVIFDPMQKGDSSILIDEFKNIASKIFMTNDIHVEFLDSEFRLQHTGGFPHIPPSHIIQQDDDWISPNVYTSETKTLDDEEIDELKLKSSESQNKFCYMWCVWYLHLKMIDNFDESLSDVVNKYLMGKDPIIVIKNYIYTLMTYTGLKRELSRESFFNENFKYVYLYEIGSDGYWILDEYSIAFPKKSQLKNVNDCFSSSFLDNARKI